jgi:hypothetical protein
MEPGGRGIGHLFPNGSPQRLGRRDFFFFFSIEVVMLDDVRKVDLFFYRRAGYL